MTTKIVNMTFNPPEKLKTELNDAVEILRKGGLVAFPTETVYGLGGDATNPDAARKIFEAKGRPSDNPLIIHISEPADAEDYTYTNEIYYKLADKFMPGPLTVILKSKENIPFATRGGLDTVAVRCPVNEIARGLIKEFGKPIAAPSANLSGSPSPTSAKHVVDDLFGRVDMIIDGGECEIGLESTIVKIEDDDSITLLRPGKITVDELACVAPVKVASAVTEDLKIGEIAISPGMKYRHYAPKSPLILLNGENSDIFRYILSDENESKAVLCYDEDIKLYEKSLKNTDLYAFGAREDISEQAKHLFAILREVDKKNFDVIYAPVPSKDGIGLALYNRMIRAAAHTIINLKEGRNG